MAKTKIVEKSGFKLPEITWSESDGGNRNLRTGTTILDGIPVTIQVEWCPDRSDYVPSMEHQEGLRGVDVLARAGVLSGAYDDAGIADEKAERRKHEERGIKAALATLTEEIKAHPSLARTPVEREDDTAVRIAYETQILEKHPDDICARARRGEQYLRQAKAQEASGEDPRDSFRMAALDLGELVTEGHKCRECGNPVRPGECSRCYSTEGSRLYGEHHWCAGDLQMMAQQEGMTLTRREADEILRDNEGCLEQNLDDSDWEILSDMLPDSERDEP